MVCGHVPVQPSGFWNHGLEHEVRKDIMLCIQKDSLVGLGVHTCKSPHLGGGGRGESGIQDSSWLHSVLQTTMGYRRPLRIEHNVRSVLKTQY